MLVVTGATGRLGRQVVDALLARVPAERIAVSVREPQSAQDLQVRGVRVRRGDFTEPASLEHAFEGATRVLIVSMGQLGEVADRGHRAAIDAAAAVGVERVVYTSHMGVGADSAFPPMRQHAATEEALTASGIPFTTLRNGFYASSAAQLFGPALLAGELRVPEDGPVAWTAHADLAEAAAIALTRDALTGVTPALTAAGGVDTAGIAAIASELSGRTVRHVTVPDAEYRAGLLERGTPEPAADMLVGLFVASRRGDFSPADPTLGRLLARAPASLRDVLAPALHPAPASPA